MIPNIQKIKRPGWESNPRPPPWQGGALTSWATGPNIQIKWTFRDLNPGPIGYEPIALTNWAKGPFKAVDRTWTGNLLITNQLLCQLSHNGILDDITHLWIVMTPTGFEPVLPPWKGGVLTTWPWSLILWPLHGPYSILNTTKLPEPGSNQRQHG